MLMLMLMVAFACTLHQHQVDGQNAVAKFTKYVGYSAVDFDSVAGVITPTEADCLALSTATPMTNGVVYQYSSKVCKLMTNTNNMIVIKLHLNPTWNAYVKDISDNFVPVYISYARQSNSATVDLFTLWQAGTGASSDYATAINNCSCTYRNSYLTQSWDVTQVKFQLDVGKLTVVSVIHDGSSSSYTDWFDLSNLLQAKPFITQSIRLDTYSGGAGYSLPGNNGDWFGEMYTGHGNSNCVDDAFYMTGASTTYCSSYGHTKYPFFIYSYTKKDEKANYDGVGDADRVVISVKVKNRVVIM